MAVTSRPAPGGERPRRWWAAGPVREPEPEPSRLASSPIDVVLTEFTACWERGEAPRAEDYLGRLDPDRPADAVELVYREFCLAEEAGSDPVPGDYLARFPELAAPLGRLIGVHDALGAARPRGWDEPPPLPEVGDEIGPYRLVGELGRGAFARVFLAEQADLDDRLVVVKVSDRVTPEPKLLARSSHPHIVEVLSHGEADGGALQVVCMPFLGGATLAAVVQERRARGGRPAAGSGLLDDLDRASVRGYPAVAAGRSARELIAGLSYPRAAAWVVARLAEALDHAYARGVIHGDVKPSNVLLTADAVPMLLDFNLSVGWRPTAAGAAPPAGELPGDAGGTLAYMAPERVRAAADPGGAPPPTAADRHRADIYALGVVLLEVLTGRAPEAPGSRPPTLRGFASAFSSRGADPGAPGHPPRAALPAGLRAVLARCLAADPAERYRRAGELAEDLDRWRTDRRLAFAREPSAGSRLARLARRRKAALVAAAAGLAVVAAATAAAWRAAEGFRRERAEAGYSQIVDGEESGAFLTRRPGIGVLRARTDPASVARRHLERYGVLGAGDWRRRDEFAGLDPSRRDELEVWLLEQALRFARALGERPGAPADWRRALYCLERAAPTPFGPLRTEVAALRRRLGLPDPPPAAAHAPPARWMHDYLRGVAAELRDDRAGRREALEHYEAVLAARPGSFWANYRAAAVAFALADDAEPAAQAPEADPAPAADPRGRSDAGLLGTAAAARLEACVRQRPENAALRRQYAGCLYKVGRFREALEECDRALSLDPDHAETSFSRMFLRLRLGQVDDFLKEFDRYQALTGHRPPASPALDLSGLRADQRPGGPAAEPVPGENVVHRTLGEHLWKAGHHELALAEVDRALEHDPDDLWARYWRGYWLATLDQPGADADFSRIVDDPRAAALVRRYPKAVYAFHRTVLARIQQGRAAEAVEVAERAVQLAGPGGDRSESFYNLARAYAFAATAEPSLRLRALESLARAYRTAPKPREVQEWYAQEKLFKGLRAEFGPTLHEPY